MTIKGYLDKTITLRTAVAGHNAGKATRAVAVVAGAKVADISKTTGRGAVVVTKATGVVLANGLGFAVNFVAALRK